MGVGMGTHLLDRWNVMIKVIEWGEECWNTCIISCHHAYPYSLFFSLISPLSIGEDVPLGFNYPTVNDHHLSDIASWQKWHTFNKLKTEAVRTETISERVFWVLVKGSLEHNVSIKIKEIVIISSSSTSTVHQHKQNLHHQEQQH